MNIEENRLYTFDNWPSNSPVDPARIAKGGFYATGNGKEVQCHWCNKKIAEWNFGDLVMRKHERLDPLCPFVVNATRTDNVPLVLGSSSDNNNMVTEDGVVDLTNEQMRLATFENWPIPYVTPQSLAKAGFYYYNQSDRVRCAWCNGVIAKWEQGDNPFTEHEKWFPNCPRVQLGPNIEIASNGIRDLGIQQLRQPKLAKYSCLDARIRSFTRWPHCDIQHPEVLATAGFFYFNIDDQVRCFHCNGGLRSWQREDDPWFEHAKWFPRCHFVQLVKGGQYIQEVQQQTRPSLDEVMTSEPVRKALEMGLHEGRVRAATKNHLEQTGKPYANVEALVDAVLDGQHEEDQGDDDNSQSSSTIVREVSRILDTIFNPRPTTSSTAAMQEDTDEDVQDIDHQTVQVTSHQSSLPLQEEASGLQQNRGESEDVKSKVPELGKTEKSSVTPLAKEESPPQPQLQQQISLEEENRKLKDARLCKVCMADEVGVVFLPCGHLVTCVQCATGVSACPLCRTSIKAYVRTFLS